MRLLLDANVVFPALLWQGPPYRLLTELRNRADAKLFCSEALFAELADVPSRPHSIKRLALIGSRARAVLDDCAAIFEFMQPAAISPTSTDPDDDAVFACALAAQGDLVVSGDPHLLNLKHYHMTPIVSPREAIERISA